MLKGDRSFHRRWEIVLADNKTSVKKPPFYIRWFVPILVLLGIAGGAAALLVPSGTDWLRQSGLSGEAEQKSISDLRLHFLYITGGIIAILTLLQTNWKNQVDRLKIDADIKKNEQDAENEAAKREQDAVKSERDHTRQVHAERRSRYTKAVEQLADEKATVRLGGIYTLVGLVDEWLTDETLDPEEQQKEGQVIINNLCSYIRSPFPLAEKIEEYEIHRELENLQKLDSEKLDEEVSSLLQTLLKRFKDSDGYEKPKDITADYAKFHEEQDVRRTIFVEMSKRSSAFIMNEKDEIIETISGMWSDFDFDFSRAPVFYPLNAITIEKGNFSSTKFYSNADFSEAKFTQTADFSRTTFARTADFGGAKFTQKADFSWAKFTRTADFSWAAFTQKADFSWAKFTRTADFSEAKFFQTATFGRAKFTRTADFSEAKFTQTADFRNAEFTSKTSFKDAYFKKYAPPFAGISGAARFSAQVNQEDYVFSVSRGSKPINCGTATLDGKSFEIPIRSVLFDPASWDEDEQDYTRFSIPAR